MQDVFKVYFDLIMKMFKRNPQLALNISMVRTFVKCEIINVFNKQAAHSSLV